MAAVVEFSHDWLACMTAEVLLLNILVSEWRPCPRLAVIDFSVNVCDDK